MGAKRSKNLAYDTAKNGGVHWGTWNNYRDRPTSMIERSIKSMEMRIEEHRSWIGNPFAKLPPDIDERAFNALVNKKWPSDISRIQAECDVLQGIMEERKNEQEE